ncbi:acyl carrier protein [Trinickia sp. LjRoot230]|uniref:acyl carrier protein n=1 Tax=Trinickia sp. LjRoot230 TaxID=3342288 RepID=UPI003ECF9F47
MSIIMAQGDIEQWLAQRLATEMALSVESIDPSKPFLDYGVDSASAVGIVADLEDRLGRPLDPNLFYEYPSIEDLAAYLASGPAEVDGARVGGSVEPLV